MCCRFKRRSDKQKIAKVFEVTAGLEESDFEPGDDLSPQSMQPVIYENADGERQIELMRWAFKMQDGRLVFNARSEDIEHSKFWKGASQTGLAIIPGDAIFEWKEMPKGQKKPKYEFTIPGQEPFGMAGVWKLWKNPKTGQWEKTFVVLTGVPNELMAPIHDRMTTFLVPRDYEEYLVPAERQPVHLLRVLPAEMMRARLTSEDPITNRQVGLLDSSSEMNVWELPYDFCRKIRCESGLA